MGSHAPWIKSLVFSPAGGTPAKKSRLSARRFGTSGARAFFAGAVGVDAQGPCAALYDLWADDDLLHPFEAGQLEHGIEEDRLHDGAQAPGSGLAVDGLAGNRLERL